MTARPRLVAAALAWGAAWSGAAPLAAQVLAAQPPPMVADLVEPQEPAAQPPRTPADLAAPQEPAAARMQAALQSLWEGLGEQQRGHGRTVFDNAERTAWSYRVAGRVGLPLFLLDDDSRERLWGLLETALGPEGAAAARGILELEKRAFEKKRDESRDPNWYFLTVFGTPRPQGTWGWRFEGHHLSVNFTVHDGAVIGTTPVFFGAQPTRVETTRGATIEPLERADAAGRTLLEALDPGQRRDAIFSDRPPDDIVTQADRRALRPPALGIRAADLTSTQLDLLRGLVGAYAARLTPELAEAEMAAIEAGGFDGVRFGWAGPVAPGQAHYYRVQGARFLIEYGNVDGDPAHVHSVWRKFDDDFGRATLRQVRAARVDAVLAPLEERPDDRRSPPEQGDTGERSAGQAPPDRAAADRIAPARTASQPDDPGPATADAAPRLTLLPGAVNDNGCDAVALVVSRRPLLATDPLPRTVMRSPDLEVLQLRVESSTARDGVEDLCKAGEEIEAISPRHPDRGLRGKRVEVTLELRSDARVGVWQASRIRARAPAGP